MNIFFTVVQEATCYDAIYFSFFSLFLRSCTSEFASDFSQPLPDYLDCKTSGEGTVYYNSCQQCLIKWSFYFRYSLAVSI